MPGIPSVEEVQKTGNVDLGDMNAKLLEKVEQLTLYVIQLSKENAAMKKEFYLRRSRGWASWVIRRVIRIAEGNPVNPPELSMTKIILLYNDHHRLPILGNPPLSLAL